MYHYKQPTSTEQYYYWMSSDDSEIVSLCVQVYKYLILEEQSNFKYKGLIFVTVYLKKNFFLDLCNRHCILILVEETITQELCPTAWCYLLINLCNLFYLT